MVPSHRHQTVETVLRWGAIGAEGMVRRNYMCYDDGMDGFSSDSARPEGRTLNGRFARGNKGGPGNPKLRHLAELQATVHDAVSPRMLEGVIKNLVKLALGGDVGAARLLLDRVLGKVRESPAETAFKLPRVKSVGDLPGALNKVMQAAARGDIDTAEALQFATMIDMTGRALAAAEVDERLTRLEAGSGLGPRKMA